MKKYLISWYFLDMGMEGWPSLTDNFIVEAKDKEAAIKQYPKDIIKRNKGWGHVEALGEIVNNNILPFSDYYNIRSSVEHAFKEAKELI